jgi:hypothetical protein
MTWLARMEDMEAVPKIQPRAFHLCGVSWVFSHTNLRVGLKGGESLFESRGLGCIPACVETDDFAKSGSRSNRSPVVYTCRGRNCRSHLCDTSSDHEVATCHSNKLINDTCWAAIVERNDLSMMSIL